MWINESLCYLLYLTAFIFHIYATIDERMWPLDKCDVSKYVFKYVCENKVNLKRGWNQAAACGPRVVKSVQGLIEVHTKKWLE